ncbi:hypothetical protein Taro_014806 [Colocasia esculenta]|uniref:Uncharacterized protein n=1 Tax=Colocasia esculenta TaxID=4460 RepID=A0A843UFK7_COLES|nr:hypothetical protein [Colocasia esculenta]
MAAKLLANLIVMGSSILGRALIQAYKKALERKMPWGRRVCDLIFILLVKCFVDEVNRVIKERA